MSGRKTVLHDLEQLYSQSGNQILVLYGRRENQSRELAREFCKGKKSFYYYAPEISVKAQKIRMGSEIEKYFQVSLTEENYDTFFKRVKSGDASKLVLVIEEFQHIMKKDETFWESILKLKAKKLYPGPVMILLCSTNVSWIEQEMPQAVGKSAKKLSGIVKMQELGFLEVARNFPDYNFRQDVEVFGIIGGLPEYLHHWDGQKDIKYNVCTHILSEDGYFHNRAMDLIRNQLRELSVYHTILEALAGGKRKLNELYQETGFSRAKISVYLKNLIELQLVEKVFSYDTAGKDNVQKGIYRISHPLVDFYYTYMYPYQSELETLSVGEFYNRYIMQDFRRYVTGYFKQVCRQHLSRLNDRKRLPVQLEVIGEWVGKAGELDIIAQDEMEHTLIGSCNWERPTTYEDYESLLSCAKKAKINADYVYMYSAFRFDERLNLETKVRTNLKLIQVSDF